MSGVGALEVHSLSADLGSRRVLENVSFDAQAGEIVCVVGPNGAGKSTLLEVLVGLRLPSNGSTSHGTKRLSRLADFAATFVYLPAGAELPPEMTVRGLVEHTLAHGTRLKELVADLRVALGIESLSKQAAGTLSRGEAQRVQLFCALAQDKPIVVLDEPFATFDPLQLRDVLATVKKVAASGAIVIAAVHQLADAEKVADRILVIQNGRGLAWGSLDALGQQTGLPDASLEQIFVALLSANHHAP